MLDWVAWVGPVGEGAARAQPSHVLIRTEDVVMTASLACGDPTALYQCPGRNGSGITLQSIHQDKTSGPLPVASGTTPLRRKYATLSISRQYKIYALTRYCMITNPWHRQWGYFCDL